MENATILIVRPLKQNDPTIHTYAWGEKAVHIAKELGYNVIDIKKEDTTYEIVTNAIKQYNPRFFIAWSHGCPTTLQGQQECMITRKYTTAEMIQMYDSGIPEKVDVFRKMFQPMGKLSCPGICKLDDDPCSPLCHHETNIGSLKGAVIMANACHTATQLGKCSINYGVESYLGYSELYMFPVDNLGTQDLFGDVQLTFFKSFLMGRTIEESEKEMIQHEEMLIRKFARIKYVALPLLWNKKYRKIYGNKKATIYEH